MNQTTKSLSGKSNFYSGELIANSSPLNTKLFALLYRIMLKNEEENMSRWMLDKQQKKISEMKRKKETMMMIIIKKKEKMKHE